jgi:hypothetical protein
MEKLNKQRNNDEENQEKKKMWWNKAKCFAKMSMTKKCYDKN